MNRVESPRTWNSASLRSLGERISRAVLGYSGRITHDSSIGANGPQTTSMSRSPTIRPEAVYSSGGGLLNPAPFYRGLVYLGAVGVSRSSAQGNAPTVRLGAVTLS